MPKTAAPLARPKANDRSEKAAASSGELVSPPSRLEDAAAAYAGAARAENTKRAYTTDFVAFCAWCDPQGLAPLPALPRTVALYLTARACAERKVATIERALVAICQAQAARLPLPS